MKLNFPATAKLTDAISGESLDLNQLSARVTEWQQQLQAFAAKRVLLLSPGNLEWALLDLACLDSNTLLVPVPTYLSEAQLQHILNSVKPDLIFSSNELFLDGFRQVGKFHNLYAYQYQKALQPLQLPADCQKITFTSGSTGTPKGVCLSAATQLQVAQSLVERIAIKAPRHLCLLPLSTLLENIAGIYAPLLAGGEVLLSDEFQRGFHGSSLAEPKKLLDLISSTQPQTLILVPELLQLLVQACQQGWQPPASLLFIAVGGAVVAPQLLALAAKAGLPVYQGYGLSECGSVVALSEVNAATASLEDLASVGKPLSHLQVKLVAGELWVKTPFLGYLSDFTGQTDAQPDVLPGEQPQARQQAMAADETQGWVATGDLALMLSDGRLQIKGRKKNLLISSLGRNINPEWVEAELLKNGLLQQAVLVGDARPYCSALLYCANPAINNSQIKNWLAQVNETLPDYARVQRFYRLSTPLSETNGTLTANQRPKRSQIAELYQAQIAALYTNDAVTDSVQSDLVAPASAAC
ncbi:AMP-binding protein [Rheinheimera sp. 4Y26]|uniref:AMP-binding protein n=1 Tax=Rheinheimera sp. 4Y26 TaxID=2977811 RepID=UPI0021B0A991|nr:AMP-binding protein [Rheinheimera sp. 4Y26]MCT6699728.1 AMP-binding protein [Rheinheimera sp. 4Y26]